MGGLGVAVMKKWQAVCAVIVATAFLGIYFTRPHPQAGSGLSADKLCRKLLAEKETREALSWLEQSNPGDIRTVGEQNPGESLRIVKGIYASGALKAYAVGIERDSGYGETTNIVCVELPATPVARQKLLEIESKVAASGGFDPVPDEGQTYLFLYKFKLSFGQTLRMLFHL